MAREQLEEIELLRGSVEDHDPQDIAPVRAYKMMPRWGQVIAWLLWELPGPLYIVVVGGVHWVFYADTRLWRALVVLSGVLLGFGYMARKRARNPFRNYVLTTRKLIPSETVDAVEKATPPGAH